MEELFETVEAPISSNDYLVSVGQTLGEGTGKLFAKFYIGKL